MYEILSVFVVALLAPRFTTVHGLNADELIRNIEHVKHVEFSFPQLCSRYVRLIAYQSNEYKHFSLDTSSAHYQLNKLMGMLGSRPDLEEWKTVIENCLQLPAFPALDDRKDIVDDFLMHNVHFEQLELNHLLENLEVLGDKYLEAFFNEPPSVELCGRYVDMIYSMKTSSPRVGFNHSLDDTKSLLQLALNSLAGNNAEQIDYVIKDLERCKQLDQDYSSRIDARANLNKRVALAV